MSELPAETRVRGPERRIRQRRAASDPFQSPTGRDRRSGRDRRHVLRRTSGQMRTDIWRGEEMETPAKGMLAKPVEERRREPRTRLREQPPVDFLPGGRAILVDISPRGMLAAHPFLLRPGQACLVRVSADGQQCTVQAIARRSVLASSKEFPGLAESAPGRLIYQTGLEVLSPPPAFTSIYTLLTTPRAGTA